jgi:hypothetical protein
VDVISRVGHLYKVIVVATGVRDACARMRGNDSWRQIKQLRDP